MNANHPLTDKQKRGRLSLLLGLATVVTLLLAGGLAGLEFLPGRPQPLVSLIQAFGSRRITFSGVALPASLFYLVGAALWALLIVSILAFILSSEVRREVFRRLIRYTIILLLIYALFSVWQPVLKQMDPPLQPATQGELGEAESAEPVPTPPLFVLDPPRWLIGGVSLIIVTGLLVMAWLLWRRFGRPTPGPSPLERLTAPAERALQTLQTGAAFKDTITRCYVEMSHILRETHGIERRQAMTPREFAVYLAASGLDSNHIERLTDLFEHARYSPAAPAAQAEKEATTCLAEIVQAYGSST